MLAIQRSFLVFAALAGLALTSCGGGGVCVADYGIVVECFDCWEQSLCEESSSRTWNSSASSCADLGYTRHTSNECGYTR